MIPQYYMPPNQRLAYLEQQAQPNMYQMPQQNNSMFLKGRPVASLEEARASMIDFDGSIYYFPDLANNRIYTKQFNLDGTSSLKVYEVVTTPAPMAQESMPVGDFVTKEDFQKTVSALCAEIDKLKGVQQKQNDESKSAYEF